MHSFKEDGEAVFEYVPPMRREKTRSNVTPVGATRLNKLKAGPRLPSDTVWSDGGIEG